MALPGDVWRNLEDGHNGQCDCDDCDQPAVGRICVEADSFGAEWAHYCQAHLEQAEAKAEEPIIGDCDWCKAVDVEVFPTRDTDEGSYGPVYDVCKCCRQKQAKRDAEEFIQFNGDDSERFGDLDDLRVEIEAEDERERQEAEWREEAEQERALQTKMVEKFMDLVKRLASANVSHEQLVNELGDTILVDDTVVDTLKDSVLRLEAIAVKREND